MTRTYAAVLAAVCLIAPAHGAAQPPERPVAAGEIMSFHSSILGEARELQVVLPEMDGRIITRAISFKGLSHRCAFTQADVVAYQPEPDRVDFVADIVRPPIRSGT